MKRLIAAALVVGLSGQISSGQIISGTDEGVLGNVKSFTGDPPMESGNFIAYAGFTGGVRVAVGDVDGDGAADIITGAGAGGGAHVKVFAGSTGTEVRSFFAYGPSFTGGVFVASGDVNNDGRDDLVTGADSGAGPHVKVFDGVTNAETRSFFAYDAAFMGGVRVAAGDVNGDGLADIITSAGAGGQGHVKVFDGVANMEVRSFLAYGANYTGGVYVASGDVTGDGRADIITGTDADFASHVKVFDGVTNAEIRSFFAYNTSFTGGVRVAVGDVNGDQFADIITGAGAGGGGHVKVFDGATNAEIRSFFAYGTQYSGGVFVAAAAVVPEPAGAALMAIAGLVGALRRRGIDRG